MVQKIIITLVVIIFFLILLLSSAAVIRRKVNARRYRSLDRMKAFYIKPLEDALEKKELISVVNSLLSTPGSIKFQAVEDLLFKFQDRFPQETRELFIRLGYVEFYEKMLGHKNKIKKAIAIDKLGRIGVETSIDKLAVMLGSGDRDIVSVTVRALASTGSLIALRSILESLPELFSRWLITRKAVETALLKFGESGSHLLLQYGRDIHDPKILAIILDTLSHLNNPGAIELAIDNLFHGDPEVRAKALKVLERFSTFLDERTIERLLPLAGDPVWFVRLHVAKILGQVSVRGDIMSFLERLIMDENWYVRNEAASALAKKGEEGINLILKIFRRGDRYAIESLSEEIEKTDLCRILINNISSSVREMKEKSLEILGVMCRFGFSTPVTVYLQSADGASAEELKNLLASKGI